MTYYERFLDLLKERYPETARTLDLRARFSPLLICAQPVPLPRHLKAEAEAIVQAFFKLRSDLSYRARLSQLPPVVHDPGNTSVLMSYDFHIDTSGHLRLIEINTNASISLVADLAHRAQGIENVFEAGRGKDFEQDIMSCFEQEFIESALGTRQKLKHLAIVDETPENQRLYIEFVMFKELFTRHGYSASIGDTASLSLAEDGLRLPASPEKINLIYNRDTDFYLTHEPHQALQTAFEKGQVALTPNPFEYRMLADKERLLELSRDGAIDALALTEPEKAVIRQTLIRTLEVREFADPDQLWRERKKWFFKPKRSFGGKAAYRGSATGRNVFNQILLGDYLAQEYVPAPMMPVTTENGEEEFKYDLRFYTYRDRIQLACARLYRGQMTNTQTPGGGIAPIEFVND